MLPLKIIKGCEGCCQYVYSLQFAMETLMGTGLSHLDGMGLILLSTEALTMEMVIFLMKVLWQRPIFPLHWGI